MWKLQAEDLASISSLLLYNTFVLDHFHNENKKVLKILAFLFKECNNSCSFCFQKRYADSIKTIPFFNNNIKQYCNAFDEALFDFKNYSETTVSLMGGELFFEKTTTRGILELINHLSGYNGIKLRFTSNLIDSDIGKIRVVMDRCHTKGVSVEFFTSFDFGNLRFHRDSDRASFIHNIDEVKKLCKQYSLQFGIETIRTKKMLESYLAEDEDFVTIRSMSETTNIC